MAILLLSVKEENGKPEGRNTGFRKIINSLEHNGSLMPVFETDDDRLSFVVTILKHPDFNNQENNGSMLKSNQEFIMLDDQKVVFEEILKQSRLSLMDRRKRTIIVQGGPGTGKTVVAINLLARLTGDGQFAQYISKNSASRNVYLKKLKGEIKKSSVDNMFKGSGIYTETERNIVDTILIDEAHRLNAKSGMFQNMGENQVKEIIHSSLCNIFFIDEGQRVTLSDIGSIEEIKAWGGEGSFRSYRAGTNFAISL